LVAAGFLTLILTAPAGPVRAASDEGDFHAKLRYRADAALPGCWDEAELRRRIGRRTGYDPFRDDAPVSVLVSVSGSARAIGGRVEWKDATGVGMGERRFVAKDGNCSKLLAEMSFAIALQIELLRPSSRPESIARSPTPSSTDAAGANTAASSAPTATTSGIGTPAALSALPEPESTKPRSQNDMERPSKEQPPEVESSGRAREPDWTAWAGLGASVAWGISPSATANLRLFLGCRRKDLSLEVGAESSYPSEDLRWGGSGFRAVQLAGTAALCGHRSALSACAVGKAGQLRVEGTGLDKPETASGFLGQAGLRFAGVAELGKGWLVGARLDGLWLVTPHTVQLNGVGVWDMPNRSVLAGLDLAVRFR